MKLGTWGWGLKGLSLEPCTFPAKSWISDRARKNGSQRRCFFMTCKTHHFCHFPCIDFRQTFHEHVSRWWLATWFHIPEKFPLRGRISRKTIFLGYKRVPCLCPGYGSRITRKKFFKTETDQKLLKVYNVSGKVVLFVSVVYRKWFCKRYWLWRSH